MAKKPEITTLSAAELDRLLLELSSALPAATYQLVEGLLRTLQWLLGAIEEKKASLRRLQKIIFGKKTEKTRQIIPKGSGSKDGNATDKPKSKGHGRRGAKDFPGAKRIAVPHPQFQAGCLCPQCLKGKLYPLKTPARLIRIVAQPIFSGLIHELQRLRCALCGALFTAPAPPEAGTEKYDPSVGPMLAIMRYGAGLPMQRMAHWQAHFGVPLPASTQWELIEKSSRTVEGVVDALVSLAAQGELVHNDDTTMRIEALRKKNLAALEGERTGIFTTAIVARVGAHQIALFFTGRNHAGENLDLVLKRRAAGLPVPLQMCDALSRNEPKEFVTLVCNCIPHARRNFVEVMENFPEPCQKVLESLREVFRFESHCREKHLTPDGRLAFHQEHSGPVMHELHTWMNAQIDQKNVEPNSGLGKAFRYMLNHWEKLTRFLQVAGAPLDNNIAERALKMAIRHRRNSLAYKTLRGAEVGDIYMSVIHTCQLNGVNPFEYLMALERNAAEVRKDPQRWLPWNYRQAFDHTNTS